MIRTGLRRIHVLTFEVLEEHGPFLPRACFSHDPAPVERVPLAGGRGCVGIGEKFASRERRGMALMGVERQHQRWAFQDDSHSRMAMAVDAALVAFGLPKPSFELQVVVGEIWIVSPDKEARCEAAHDLGHVLTDRMLVLLQCLLKGLKGCLSLLGRPGLGIERRGYRTDGFEVRSDFFLGRLDLRQPPVYASRQTPQAPFGDAPFFASRLRCSDARTSPRAPAIRNPGGSRGPP